MSARPRLVVGLDWSVTSPAAAAQLYSSDGKLQHTWAMCFQQRRATPQQTVHQPTETFTLTEWPMYNHRQDKTRWGVVNYHTCCFIEWMKNICNYYTCDCDFFIEDYAYGVKKTSSFSKLAEDAGVVMHKIYVRWLQDTHALAISSIKKFWSGNGAARKGEMYEAYKRRGYPDLLEPLRCPHPDANPVSDIVDAIAVAGLGWSQIQIQ